MPSGGIFVTRGHSSSARGELKSGNASNKLIAALIFVSSSDDSYNTQRI